jgi:magnesium-transporting ATPase (P-type)
LNGFFLFLWDTFFTFDLCILLLHVLLAALSSREDECWNIIYCVAAINIIGQAALNLFHDGKLKQASDRVNKLSCDKFVFTRRHKQFQQRPWDELNVGDIIKIKKNNQVPADCLILDIKSNNNIQTPEPVCYVKGGRTAARGEAEIKKSCQNTQNKTGNSRLSDSKFVQLLSGQLKWEFSNKGKYHGSLKLNENPAAFEFKNEHVLFRGSSIYLTD